MLAPTVDWSLDLDYRSKRFAGRVALSVTECSGPLVLNAADLTIDGVRVDGTPATFRADPASATVTVEGVESGAHTVEITYRGAADADALLGFYTAPCGSGYALTTMFFPTGSRRLLPSFEHPSVKSVFRFELTVDADVKSVFNTAPVAERVHDGRRTVSFEPTPKMSAYLLYLGVGPFDSVSDTSRPRRVTVWSSPGRATGGRYCAERASDLLAEYERYYGIAYPLSKLDLVGLENFWAGAMENWGAISFRENLLIVDPTSSSQDLQATRAVLAHEIAHQWFGNLVTPKDWQDFWLNESFATFVGYRIGARVFSEEDALAYLLNRWVGPALEADSLRQTHPVRQPVAGPDALGEISDEITYGKGAAVLRMFESYLGEEEFRGAVSRYLSDHQYSNASADDLWAAMERTTGRPVGRMVNAWISRPGYPVVHARWEGGRLSLRQEQFRADGSTTPEVWPVPLRLRSSEGERTLLMEGPTLDVPVADPSSVRIDPGRASFLRIRYDATLYRHAVAEFPRMAAVDQWGLLADTHAFVYAGLTSVDDYLDLVSRAAALTDPIPVLTAVRGLRDLGLVLFDSPAFRDRALQFLRAQLDRLGLERAEGEPDEVPLVREPLVTALVHLDSRFAQELAQRWSVYDGLAPELRAPVAVSVGRAGGAEGFDRLRARLGRTTDENERVNLSQGLAASPDPGRLRRALDLAFGPELTASGAFPLLMSATANEGMGTVLFDWYRDNAPALVKRWAGTPLLSFFLKFGLVNMGIGQPAAAADFFATHAPAGAAEGVKTGLESLRLATAVRERR